MSLTAGAAISRYRILSQIGAGGSGEVYLALDVRLKRTVALRVLPAAVAADPALRRRLWVEVEAAAALNHPNIAHLYEAGETEAGDCFVATEYVKGRPLDALIGASPIEPSAILSVAIPVADALDAAHSGGVMHGNLKPANLVITPLGQVKVLDFGLAALTAPRPQLFIGAASTQEAGTEAAIQWVQYLSPEQLLGWRVDHRTDLFSLGVVLYQMAAGRAPFLGATAPEVITSILEKESAPLAQVSPGASAEWERIVTIALAKDRAERYQTARELLADLEILRLSLKRKARLENSARAAPRAAAAVDESKSVEAGQPESGSSGKRHGTGTGQARVKERARVVKIWAGESQRKGPQTVRLGALLGHQFKRQLTRGGIAAVVVILSVAALLLGLYGFTLPARNSQPAAPRQARKIAKLTGVGRAVAAAASPDGKYVAYASAEGEKQALWLRHISPANHLQLIPAAEVEYRGLTFSLDGQYLYFIRAGKGATFAALYQLAIEGGATKRLVADLDSPANLSPDGRRFAFVRRRPGQGVSVLMVINSDGTGEQRLSVHQEAERFTSLPAGPAWSPDGKMIAWVVEGADTSGRFREVVEVRLADGAEKIIGAERWAAVEALAWLPAGEGLVVSAAERRPAPLAVFFLPYPGGEPRRVTDDHFDYHSLSPTADGHTLAAVQSDQISSEVVLITGFR